MSVANILLMLTGLSLGSCLLEIARRLSEGSETQQVRDPPRGIRASRNSCVFARASRASRRTDHFCAFARRAADGGGRSVRSLSLVRACLAPRSMSANCPCTRIYTRRFRTRPVHYSVPGVSEWPTNGTTSFHPSTTAARRFLAPRSAPINERDTLPSLV